MPNISSYQLLYSNQLNSIAKVSKRRSDHYAKACAFNALGIKTPISKK